MFKIAEKKNHLAIHGVFETRERAEQHLKDRIPAYVRLGYFIDKTLTADSFEVIPA